MDHPTAEDVIEVLSDINEDFLHPPPDTRRIQKWLEMISPHVHAAGPNVQASYIAAKKKLVDSGTFLIDPATGARIR